MKDPLSRSIHPKWKKLSNLRMAEKLSAGECIDVSTCERTVDGDYILGRFVEGVDYCNAISEQWIWSIGEDKITGEILASTSTKFYESTRFKCLWLR